MTRTGFQNGNIGISQSNVTTLKLNWTFQSGAPFQSSPIVYNGTVYGVDYNGQLTALNAQTGQVVWQRQLGHFVTQTPAIYDGILFVGAHDTQSPLYALDPATGNILWQTTVPGGLKGSPVVVNGVLYEGIALGDVGFCRPGGIYSFDEHSGSADLTWLVESSTQPDGGSVWGPISWDGASLYYGTGNTCTTAVSTANAVVAANPATLTPSWAHQTANALSDDDVGGGVLVSDGIGYVNGKNGHFYAYRLNDGTLLWSTLLNGWDGLGSITVPSITESTIITSAGGGSFSDNQGDVDGGSLIGMDMAGNKLWSISTDQEIRGSLAVTKDLAFAALDNAIDAINPRSGAILWSYAAAGEFSASPALAENSLFVADMSGMLYAFTTPQYLSHSSVALKSRENVHPAQKGRVPVKYRSERPRFCAVSSSLR